MTELIAFFGGSAYVVFKNIMLGNDINDDCAIGKKAYNKKIPTRQFNFESNHYNSFSNK